MLRMALFRRPLLSAVAKPLFSGVGCALDKVCGHLPLAGGAGLATVRFCLSSTFIDASELPPFPPFMECDWTEEGLGGIVFPLPNMELASCIPGLPILSLVSITSAFMLIGFPAS